MCENCSKTISKFVLVIINLIFLLAGMLMLAFGIAIVAAPDKVLPILGSAVDIKIIPPEVIKASGIFMIIMGGIVGIIGMFGFFGACCENYCMLVTYIVIMVLILLAEVALIIFAAVFPKQLKTYVQDGMKKTLITNFTRQDLSIVNDTVVLPNDPDGTAWLGTQFGVGCCGATGPKDYANVTQRLVWINNVSFTPIVPVSCCALKTPGVPKSSHDFQKLYECLAATNVDAGVDLGAINKDDCYAAVDHLLLTYAKIAIGIAAGIVGLQIILIIMGIIMAVHIRRYGKSAAI